jgi:8-oxo-dGTP diphosphatase
MVSTGQGAPSDASGPDLLAAGAVVVRRTDGAEVLLVHRPKYDDWSWPKGKQKRGEHITATAVREVLEETGVEIGLGRPLPRQVYVVSGGRTKQVHYWTGRVLGDPDTSGFTATDEVDRVAWTSFGKARRMLTYADDVALLEQVERHPKGTRVLVVLRHAHALKRATWTGEDAERPLSRAGRRDAKRLSPVLAAYGVTRVVSSDSTRCRQTVARYAAEHVLRIDADPRINEDEWTLTSVEDVVTGLLRDKESSLLCSHRPVLPAIFGVLGVAEEPLAPGEMVVCHHRKGRVVASERHLVR